MSNTFMYLFIFVNVSCSLLIHVSSGALNTINKTIFDFNNELVNVGINISKN